jgi:hypothetical protein
MPSRDAIIGPKKNPRASKQTIAEILEREWVVVICEQRLESTASVAAGSRKMGNMSAKSWPS